MATSLRTVPSSYSGKWLQPLHLGSEHPQSVHRTGGRGTRGVRGGQKSNSAQSSHNLWQTWDAAYGTWRNLSCTSPLAISGPQTTEEKLGMKPNWVAWVWSQPANLQHREGRQGRSPESHEGQGHHPLLEEAWLLCWNELLRPPYWAPPLEQHASPWAARGQQPSFRETQLPLWSLPQAEGLLF